MPTNVSGIGAMITSGVLYEWNQPTTSRQINTSTAAKAKPKSRNTSYVICHSPSHLMAIFFASGG
jgi:hypothetical protein